MQKRRAFIARTARSGFVAALAAIAGASLATAGTCKVATPLQFVAVMYFDQWTFVSSYNPLPETACVRMQGSPRCRALPFMRVKQLLPLYARPDASGDPVSYIVLHTEDDQTIFSYVKGADAPPVTVTPDDVTEEAVFQQTLLDRRGDWFLIALPAPLKGTGWVHLPNTTVRSLIGTADRPEVLELGSRSVVVTRLHGTAVTMRDEQESDSDMDEGPRKLTPFKPTTMRLEDLYDDGCRLKVKIKYKMGC